MRPDPGDEARRVPGGPDWSDAWHLDAWTPEGVGLTVRLELLPDRSVAHFWTYLVLPDLTGPVVVRDHDVPLPRGRALEVRTDGLWAELWCETPLEHWTYGLEAFAVRLDEPGDALEGEVGERVPVGLDLEWEVGGPAHVHRAARRAAGYVLPGHVHGDVLLGRDRFELDACGMHHRTWGAPGQPIGAWSWRGGMGEEFLFVEAEPGGEAEGSVWRGGVEPAPIADARAEMHGAAGRVVVDDRTEIALDVLGAAPVPLDNEAALERALCRATEDDGVTSGWWMRAVSRGRRATRGRTSPAG